MNYKYKLINIKNLNISYIFDKVINPYLKKYYPSLYNVYLNEYNIHSFLNKLQLIHLKILKTTNSQLADEKYDDDEYIYYNKLIDNIREELTPYLISQWLTINKLSNYQNINVIITNEYFDEINKRMYYVSSNYSPSRIITRLVTHRFFILDVPQFEFNINNRILSNNHKKYTILIYCIDINNQIKILMNNAFYVDALNNINNINDINKFILEFSYYTDIDFKLLFTRDKKNNIINHYFEDNVTII